MTFIPMTGNTKNPWTLEDEQEHFPCALEWWCSISFLKTKKENKQFTFKGALVEWCEESETIGSLINMALHDLETDKHFVHYSRNDDEKLRVKKQDFEVWFEDSYMRGRFPSYWFFYHDSTNDIVVELRYEAQAMPHWVAQKITGGWLPMGLGFYRYGFIPYSRVTGSVIIKGKRFDVEGTGYYEHIWGDFEYSSPFTNPSGLRKSFSVYSKLIGWWLCNHRLKIPDSLMFSTENNMFGYDWAWSVFDNGWSIFYGNILFWIMEGPITGSLIFTKDGSHYKEFCDVTFKYHKTEQSKNFDFYYPSVLELNAVDGDERLHLFFKKIGSTREYVSKFLKSDYWLGFVICEIPGEVTGFYTDGVEKIPLHGFCKIEPQRQASVLGHNSLRFDFIKPPKGVGVSFELDSHFLKKNVRSKIQFSPRPCFNFQIKRY